MANLTITPIQSDAAGTDSAPVTVTSSDTGIVANSGRTLLMIASTPGATVTIVTPRTVGDLAVAERVLTVPAAGVVHVAGPFDQTTYGASMSFTTSATVTAFAVNA